MQVLFLIIGMSLIGCIAQAVLDKSGNTTWSNFVGIITYLLGMSVFIKLLVIAIKEISNVFGV